MRLESEDGTPRPQDLWAVLSREEAVDLLLSLTLYFDEERIDPGWHTHIEGDGSALNIVIEPPTKTVYVELLDEGLDDVWRPVAAAVVGEGDYVLPPSAPADEVWAISPGSRVRCETRDGDLYAVEARPE
jgi:hypothetical protein